MKLKTSILIFSLSMLVNFSYGRNYIYDIDKLGYSSKDISNYSPVMVQILSKIKEETTSNDNITIRFSQGKYTFRADGAVNKDYDIANHDKVAPVSIAIDLCDISNLTIDGQGSEFNFDGRIIPVAAVNCQNLKLKNFTIDFSHPQITQMEVMNNQGNNGIIYYLAPWIDYDIDNKSGRLINRGYGWESSPETGIIFNRDNKTIIYRSSDIQINTENSDSIESRVIESPNWVNDDIKTGMIVVARGKSKPAPGIFISESRNTSIENVTIHYAEGMGIIAQSCENITLESLKVSLRSKSDRRYFTTISDATHFTGCKGRIVSTDGLYENMMGNAIHVHGRSVKVISISDDRKEIIAENQVNLYHGIKWGENNDSISFFFTNTLDVIHRNSIASITYNNGNSELHISLNNPIPDNISIGGGIQIENTTWTPEVDFSNNTIRNNRYCGCHISTPGKVKIENNLFTNISGCAILINGYDNGISEIGACKDVSIIKNRFIDVMTSSNDVSQAIISISPKNLNEENQKEYFHSNIRIEENYFETFDRPIVYARSVNGLVIRKNFIYGDTRYQPFHKNNYTYCLKRILNYSIEDNSYSGYKFDQSKDISFN